MARTTIGDIVSRVRNQVKSVRQDAFLTDRVIYSNILTHAKFLMKREDSKNKLMAFNGVMQVMDYVELITVDKVDAYCTGIKSDMTFKRTKEKVPVFLQGYFGPLIRTVSSLDSSEELQPILPSTFLHVGNSKNFKYNKTKYYWYLNDYLYFPNLDWEAVRIEGIFEDDISGFTCADDACKLKQDQLFNVPDYLLAEIENQVFKDFTGTMSIPSDTTYDKQHILR